MKTAFECRACVMSQARRVVDILGVRGEKKEAILQLCLEHTSNFNPDLPPPMNAYLFYEQSAEILGVRDLYQDIKQSSTQKAKEFTALCLDKIARASDKLLCATKSAVAGNVIDLASSMQYDLKEELDRVYGRDFEIDDFAKLKEAISRAKTIVYLSDNAGEEIFDKLYIQTINELFSSVKVYYFTRGRPIINDITYDEALNSGLGEVAEVIDSGVPTPGFVIELANERALKLFKKADLIIAKGMGNYECLSEISSLPIFYLFKVKCEVVGAHVGAKLGSIVCKKG